MVVRTTYHRAAGAIAIICLSAFMSLSHDIRNTKSFIDIASGNPRLQQSLASSQKKPESQVYELPPIECFVQNVGNVSSLLDFAILGFTNYGTTTLSSWFDTHPEIEGIAEESFALLENQPCRLAHRLDRMKQKNIHSGNFTGRRLPKQFYKQPNDAYSPHVLSALNTHWPNARLIYTTSHPVEWFERDWNFRFGGKKYQKSAIGRKGTIQNMVYDMHTGLGEFHIFMAMLGKTRQTDDPDEWKLIESFLDYDKDNTTLYPFPKMQNEVFFLDTKQLSDKNASCMDQLRRDLSNFLDLSTELAELPHAKPETLEMTEAELTQSENNSICGSEHVELRRELLRIGEAASKWLRNYFMKSEGVHFSSGVYLEEILKTWSVDPCLARENFDHIRQPPVSSQTVQEPQVYELPPLQKLVRGKSIVANVSSLLDFAVIGFAKCGTTTLSSWFDTHPEMEGIDKESFALLANEPVRLTSWLYSMKQKNIRSGNFTGRPLPKQFYKQPKDAYAPHVLSTLDRHWPNAKLIYALRHPVEWFESYWNFRHWTRKYQFQTSAIGRKGTIQKMAYKLHTGLGEFHIFMAMLGKTRQTDDPEEWKLIQPFLNYKKDNITLYPFPKIQNQAFFLDSKQLSDKNKTRLDQLRRDLSKFLDLSTELAEIPHVKPETLWMTEAQLTRSKKNRVSICGEKNVNLRRELLRIGEAASKWLRNYFMKSEGVQFSSGEHLEEILKTWSVDPCLERKIEVKI